MTMRGIRGATTTEQDTPEEIRSATLELLGAILQANALLKADDIASVIFTVTQDLQSAFPAQAARELGWEHVPLLDALELAVPGSLPRCIRVLIHWNTSLPQPEIHPVYLRQAKSLRPDLVSAEAKSSSRSSALKGEIP